MESGFLNPRIARIHGGDYIYPMLVLVRYCLVAFLCLCTGCFPVINKKVMPPRQEKTARAEAAIKDDPALGKLDELCKTVPTLEGFVFSHKFIGGNKRSVGYSFVTVEDKFTEYSIMRNFYKTYLTNLSWRLNDDRDFGSKWLEFEKDGQYIMVGTAPSGMGCCKMYELSCSNSSFR